MQAYESLPLYTRPRGGRFHRPKHMYNRAWQLSHACNLQCKQTTFPAIRSADLHHQRGLIA